MAGAPIATGYKNNATLLENIHSNYPNTQIRFIGNGTALYRQEIIDIFGTYALLPDPMPDTCSIQQIGLMGLTQWQQGNTGTEQLLPLYLKLHPAQQALNS